MPTPRSLIVDPDEPGFYHCYSRCVRRAYLCGDGFDHRRRWIRDGLKGVAAIFAIDVASFSVLDNHFHVVVRTDPHRPKTWSNVEVLRRWSKLNRPSIIAWAKSFTKTGHFHSVRPRGPGSGVHSSDEQLDAAIMVLAHREGLVNRVRKRLSDLGEFMKELKEPISRRANAEDGCRGHFWESRYGSIRLLDDAAVLQSMIYVDLNLVRAALASIPEQSDHTSIQDRIRVIEHFQKHLGPQSVDSVLGQPVSEGDDSWLAPIDCRDLAVDCTEGGVQSQTTGVLPMTALEYIELVDASGRMVREGKRGTIPASVPPILTRLGLEPTTWSLLWSSTTELVGTAVGTPASLVAEAARRRQRRIQSVWNLSAPG